MPPPGQCLPCGTADCVGLQLPWSLHVCPPAPLHYYTYYLYEALHHDKTVEVLGDVQGRSSPLLGGGRGRIGEEGSY